MVASKQRRLLFLGGASLVALSSWAGARLWSATTDADVPSSHQPQLAVKKTGRDLPEVTTLYERGGSAYHARLFADEEAVVLVTQTGFTTFRAGKAPEEHAGALGVAVRQGGALVFWRDGSLREISLSGEGERSLAPLSHPPRYLLASEEHLAWIQMEGETRTSLQTLSAGVVRQVYGSADSVSAAVMRGADVYWVLRSRDGSWKIGRVGRGGEHQLTSSSRAASRLARTRSGRDLFLRWTEAGRPQTELRSRAGGRGRDQRGVFTPRRVQSRRLRSSWWPVRGSCLGRDATIPRC
jgi:hypothetical protein